MTILEYALAREFRDRGEVLRRLGFRKLADDMDSYRFGMIRRPKEPANAAAARPPLPPPSHPPAVPHAEIPKRAPRAPQRQKRPNRPRNQRNEDLGRFAARVLGMATGPVRPPGYWYDIQQKAAESRRQAARAIKERS